MTNEPKSAAEAMGQVGQGCQQLGCAITTVVFSLAALALIITFVVSAFTSSP
jgi:hypothetical protein